MIEEVEEREVVPYQKTLGSLNGDLVSLIETLQHLASEMEPQLKKITAEIGPTVNGIKASLDKDETILLVEKLAANTGTMLELVTLLEAAKDLMGQLEPKLKNMMGEISPLANRVKASLDKDETFMLIEKLTSNTGTFLELLSMMEAVKDLAAQIGAKKHGLMSELAPKLHTLRKFVDDDEIWTLIGNTLVLKKPVAKLVDGLVVTNEAGEASAPLVESSIGMLHNAMEIAGAPLVQNLVEATAKALTEVKDTDIKPVTPLGMISALRDKDVQRATGFLFYVLKQIGKNLKA